MQYIAAPGNAYSQASAPEMFFFDEQQDNIDLDQASTSLTALETAVRDARTTLGNQKATMITRGQKDSVYYLTELARTIGGADVSRLSNLIGPNAFPYGAHQNWAYGVGTPTGQFARLITLIPSELVDAHICTMPTMGVRSSISASRVYLVTINIRAMSVGLSILNYSASGYYTPPSSPSGGTESRGENNTFGVNNNITHLAWPTTVTVSDTGYGPLILYPSTDAANRGIRIKEQVKPSDDVFNLTAACMSFSNLLVKLKKGVDYSISDDCHAGTSYSVDFSQTVKVFQL